MALSVITFRREEPHIMRKTVNESTFDQEVMAGRAQMKKRVRLQGQPC